MIDDDIDLNRREAAIERERGYRVGRRRERTGRRWGWGRDRYDGDAPTRDDERRGDFVGGVSLGSGGAMLVLLGLLLMAFAYFSLGAGGAEGFSGYDSGTGFSPAVDRFSDGYSSGAGGGYTYGGGGDDFLSQRPMMFMGGGFLFLAGWILVVASRLRSFLADDVRD